MPRTERLDSLPTVLADRYEIGHTIGSGGVAIVFRAQDRKHDRPVAIKVLRPELASSITIDRFLREIRFAAQLQHPHILPLHDSGEIDGLPYYVMPLIEGETLRYRLTREKQLPIADAVRFVREAADALQFAHERGIIHRDIKPENLLLSAGHVLVADFGIARAISKADAGKLTDTGIAIGTPSYMSPEQAFTGDVDARSDVYSLGCVLHELLVGEPPFGSLNAMALLARHSAGSLPSMRVVRPSIPQALEAVVNRALATDPTERFQSAGALSEVLGQVLPTNDVARPTSTSTTPDSVDTIRFASTLQDTSTDRAIAVLPFINLSNDPETDYFSDGVTDEIIGTLARVKHLRVAGRASSFALKGKELDLRTIGERLGVARVVEGSVRRVGNRVRISAELVDVSDGFQRWSDRFDRDLTDVFALQDEIAQAIAQALAVTTGSATTPSLVANVRRAAHPEAYELYLKALYEYRSRGIQGVTKALEYLEASVVLDPTFAPVHSALGAALYSLAINSLKRPDEVAPRALEHIRRAITLDPGDAAARSFLGAIRFMHEWDWESAQVDMDRALSLAPNHSGVLNRAALFHLSVGRLDLAFTLAERSLTADPMSAWAHSWANRILVTGGEVRRGIEVGEAGLRIQPKNVDLMQGLGVAYAYAGRFDDALRLCDAAVANSNRNPTAVACLAVTHACRVDREAANALLDELLRRRKTEIVHARVIGEVLMHLDRVDEAFVWFDQAVDDRDGLMAIWGVDRQLARIRGDPRWEKIRQRIGIPN